MQINSQTSLISQSFINKLIPPILSDICFNLSILGIFLLLRRKTIHNAVYYFIYLIYFNTVHSQQTDFN